MSNYHLLLASQSPRRRQLLALLGLPFEVTAADITETPRTGETPAELVARLSQAKARVAATKDAIVIACDTVVALERQILGKPHDPGEAISMLRRLRGRPHSVCSAVTLLTHVNDQTVTDLVETQVVMRNYTDPEIAAYVASGDPLDKAGAYAIQHDGFHPVAALEGCYASVMGLPLCHLTRSLRMCGVRPPTGIAAACQAHNNHHCEVHQDILTGQPGKSTL